MASKSLPLSIEFLFALQVSCQQIQKKKRTFYSERNSLNPLAVLEERTGFTDLAKHMGNYVYRGVVRRVSYLCFAFFFSFILHLVYVEYDVRLLLTSVATQLTKARSHGTRGNSFFFDFVRFDCD